MKRIIFLFLIVSTTSFAGSIAIPLDPNLQGRPADDLVYQGKFIDSDEALDLVTEGQDLSALDFSVSDFWVGKKLNIETDTEYPQGDSSFDFHSFLKAPTEIFRASVNLGEGEKKKRYTLNLSLDNHSAILRAGLLRLLGYDVELPKYYQTLTINFLTVEKKEEFLLKISEQTLTGTQRWVLNETETSLTLKSVVLEPAKIKTLNVYWGVMDSKRQDSRRSFRALLAPFIITDYVENVNLISWELGQIFNNQLILSYPYAEEFQSVTLADLHWSLRKLLNLSRSDWNQVFSHAGYPENIRELILEKTLSRMISLIEKTKMKDPVGLNVNDKLMLKHVIDGKLIHPVDADKHALIFYSDDPENPSRVEELFRFFKIRLVYGGLSTALNELQKAYIPIDTQDAFEKAQEKISNGSEPFIKPIAVWTAPYANARLRGSRAIVFGQFKGATAPIQLVDSMSLEFNAGIVGKSKSFGGLSPGGSLGASLIRTFSHIKAMPDIKTASKYNFKNLYIPSLIKDTAESIETFKCSVDQSPHVVEFEIEGKTFYQIRYDKLIEGEKEKALVLREKLISEGKSEEQIILGPIDRAALCKKEEEDNLDSAINLFLEKFSLDETFSISDEIKINTGINANIPINIGIPASARVNARDVRKLLRSFLIRKRNDGFEVIWNKQKSRTNSIGVSANLFIRLLSDDFSDEKHQLKSDAYFIDLKEGSVVKRKLALSIIKSLFLTRNTEVLDEQYQPIEADHEVKSRWNDFKFLFWSHEKFRMSHDLSLRIIDNQNKEQERNFFTHIQAKRNGRDNLAFVSQVLGDLTAGLLGGIIATETADPGQSLWGKSSRFLVYSEVETTNKYDPNMVVQVQWGYKGSGNKYKKLDKIFKKLEKFSADFGKKYLIDRGHFKQMSQLKSYDIQANLLIYPSAHKALWYGLNQVHEVAKLELLINLYGKENYDRVCNETQQQGGTSLKVGKRNYCVPFEIRNIFLKLDKLQEPLATKEKTIIVSEIFYNLFNDFDNSKVLQLIGSKNWFYNIKVSGFRSENAGGYVTYLSDSLGNYDGHLGTGILDYIGKKLKISSYELKAMKFTPGLQ